jgi:hypothetical protein
MILPYLIIVVGAVSAVSHQPEGSKKMAFDQGFTWLDSSANRRFLESKMPPASEKKTLSSNKPPADQSSSLASVGKGPSLDSENADSLKPDKAPSPGSNAAASAVSSAQSSTDQVVVVAPLGSSSSSLNNGTTNMTGNGTAAASVGEYSEEEGGGGGADPVESAFGDAGAWLRDPGGHGDFLPAPPRTKVPPMHLAFYVSCGVLVVGLCLLCCLLATLNFNYGCCFTRVRSSKKKKGAPLLMMIYVKLQRGSRAGLLIVFSGH